MDIKGKEVTGLDVKTVEEARTSAGITQEQMAKHLQMSRQTYSQLEKAPEKMTIAQARAFCSLVGSRLEEVIFSNVFSGSND